MKGPRKAVFVIDALPDKQYEGFTYGDTWNGWACPYFEHAEAKRVLEASEANGYTWTYDEVDDAFVVAHEEDPEDDTPEVFEGTEIPFHGDSIKVYGIGAHSWIWEEVT